MKATELRIGNYLMFGETRHQATHHDIRNLYESELINKVPSSTYQPIPLTEEWLLKFGFDKTIGWYRVVKGDIFTNGAMAFEIVESHPSEYITYFRNFNEGEIDDFVQLNKIKHIHQLQNLYFALTSEELTISNGTE